MQADRQEDRHTDTQKDTDTNTHTHTAGRQVSRQKRWIIRLLLSEYANCLPICFSGTVSIATAHFSMFAVRVDRHPNCCQRSVSSTNI